MHCPNPMCSNHKNPRENFYRKNGKFFSKKNNRYFKKFKCKDCGQSFSESFFEKVEIDIMDIIKLYLDNYSEEKIAKHFNISKSYIEEKIKKFVLEFKKDIRITSDNLYRESFVSYVHSKDNLRYIEILYNKNGVIEYIGVTKKPSHYSKAKNGTLDLVKEIRSNILRFNPRTKNGPKSDFGIESMLFLYAYIHNKNN